MIQIQQVRETKLGSDPLKPRYSPFEIPDLDPTLQKLDLNLIFTKKDPSMQKKPGSATLYLRAVDLFHHRLLVVDPYHHDTYICMNLH